MRILVAGGAGSIGSELVRQLAPKHKVFILDNNETGTFDLAEELQHKGYWVHPRVGSVCDKATVDDVFADFKPQAVINAAAMKHVTPMEATPLEAINVNVLGTYNLLHASKRWKVRKFVQISTDKVVNAHSIMGGTKLLGEIMVRNEGYTAVRFGNVMGSRGSVLPFWENQINRGDDVTVTHKDMTRYMMTIEEACSLVIEAMKIGKGGETICLDMGKKHNILELAKRIIEESGSDSKIRMIGKRPGETLTEELMTSEEKERAVKKGKFLIV